MIIFLFTAIPTQAQVQVEQNSEMPLSPQAPLNVEHMGVADGLNQGSVYAIHQDSHGFMWFGTQTGLNRYDGYDVTTFGTDPFDSTSFQGGFVSVIEEDREGELWIGTTDQGISRFNSETGTFKRYPYLPSDTAEVTSGLIFDIMEGLSNKIWISMHTEGLTRLDPETGDYKRYIPDPEDSADLMDYLTYLHQDSTGIIWIGSLNGLNQFDPRTGEVSRHIFEPEARLVETPFTGSVEPTGNTVLDITPDPNDPNILWLTGKGLIRFDKQTGDHKRFLPDSSHSDDPASNALIQISPDRDRPNFFWLTTSESGLLRFNTETKQFKRHQHDPDNPNSLNSNNLFSIYTDRTGMIWTGTFDAKGLNHFDPHAGGMEHYGNESVFSVWQDQKEMLWIGTGSEGLRQINRRTGTVKQYRHEPADPTSLSGNNISEIYKDSDGSLWIGTGDGLDKMNRTTGTFSHFRHDPQDTTSITDGNVRSILEDRQGNLWIGTAEGLNKMNRETETFTRFNHDPTDTTSLANDSIYSLFEDHSGNLWVGTRDVLHRMSKEKDQFTRYAYNPERPSGISSGSIINIHERKNEPGVLWIGLSSGLDRFDTRTGEFRHYTIEDGLPDNTIYGILEDDDGRLWMSTNRGISRFNPETERFKNYGIESGLQALEFNSTSYYQAPDGEMFFGGINGVNAFHPERLLGNPTPPKVSITDFNLFDRPVEPGPDSPLQVPLIKAKEIRLKHDQNNIAFEYVGLHYRNPEENRYRYMLEGFDDDWVDADTRRIARYTNLDHGNYNFKVKAANSDGVWTEEVASIQVTVLPPWWRTWWAYIIYGLILVAGVFTVDRIQRRRLIQKERERAREKELNQEKEHARELKEAYNELETAHENLKAAQEQLVQQEKLASLGQLTAGIAHEIKNPLNFVNNFSDLSLELVEEAREELSAFSRQLSGGTAGKSPFEGGGSDPSTDGEESGDVTSVEEALDILDDVEANLKKINEHGNRADGIVKSMLQHSRGGSGEMEPTDLNALIEEYVNLSFHGMRAGKDPINVDIQLDLDEEIEEMPLITEDFSRVIVNLCNNAFDAMREKTNGKGETADDYLPKLLVRTQKNNDEISIEIEDNGPGIPEEMKDKILQPFFTTKKGKEGTGLGLSITNDIVKAHGGEIQIESKKDKFTCFKIIINSS